MNEQKPVIFLRENKRKQGERDPDLTGTWKQPGQPERWAAAWWNKRGEGYFLRVVPGREKEESDTNQHPAEVNPAGNTPPMNARYQPNRSSGPPPNAPYTQPDNGPPGQPSDNGNRDPW